MNLLKNVLIGIRVSKGGGYYQTMLCVGIFPTSFCVIWSSAGSWPSSSNRTPPNFLIRSNGHRINHCKIIFPANVPDSLESS